MSYQSKHNVRLVCSLLRSTWISSIFSSARSDVFEGHWAFMGRRPIWSIKPKWDMTALSLLFCAADLRRAGRRSPWISQRTWFARKFSDSVAHSASTMPCLSAVGWFGRGSLGPDLELIRRLSLLCWQVVVFACSFRWIWVWEGSDGLRNVALAGWVLSARFLPSEWFLERFSVKIWAVGTPVSINSLVWSSSK